MDHHSRFVPGHSEVILPNGLVALCKIRHGFWQLVAVSGNPHIQSRQQKDAEQQSPIPRTEHRVKNDENSQDRQRKYDHEALLRTLLALVFAGPVNVIADGELNLLVHLLDGLFDRAAEVAATDAVLDRDITRIFFAVDFRGAVLSLDLRKLSQ